MLALGIIAIGITLGMFATLPEWPLFVIEILYYHANIGQPLIDALDRAQVCASARAGL